MILLAWRSRRGLIPASMMIFLNLGSKQATTRCTNSPTRSPSSPTRSLVLIQDVIDLLYEIIIHRMTKQIKSKLDGTNIFID